MQVVVQAAFRCAKAQEHLADRARVVELAGLEAGKRGIKQAIHDIGYFNFGGNRFMDDKIGGHGMVDLHKTIVVSCNTYYYQLANDLGIDFERVRIAMTHRYPRAADIPPAGLASGPCLLKDTLQLAGSHPSEVVLAAASMAVNEGLPAYLVGRAGARWPLAVWSVGILGLSFMAESVDVRSCLAQELRRPLEVRAARVLCTDPYVTVDPTLVPMEVVLAEADVLFIGAPHAVYRMEDLAERDVVDVWNLLARGVLT